MNVGSDFSGVGAFDQALKRLKIDYKTVFACDMDKYARQTYIENYGEPGYFPKNVYDREIPEESLDIYMTSPPCQTFSLAGKRKAEEDKRGILFYNSLEFIKKNKPKIFIFENVKGLLSADNGKVFQNWLQLLGNKINGNTILFPHEDSINYSIYWQVLNSKDYGVPQNRERVFIVGFREDREFTFPKKEYLKLKLKDILDNEVDDKYFLSEHKIKYLNEATRAIGFTDRNKKQIANCILASYYKQSTDSEYITHSLYPRSSKSGKGGTGHLSKSDNTSYCVDTGNSQAVEWIADYRNDEGLRIRKNNISPCMAARKHSETDISTMPPIIKIKGAALRTWPRNKKGNEKRIKRLEIRNDNVANAITSHQLDSIIKEQTSIRRLTPRECFRLQDFPETFKWICSDSQAYKQAGNSITVGVLTKIIEKCYI